MGTRNEVGKRGRPTREAVAEFRSEQYDTEELYKQWLVFRGEREIERLEALSGLETLDTREHA